MARLLYLTTAAAALVAGSPAISQTTPPPGDQPPASTGPASRTTIYDAAFFAQYAPRTALDIARRVPGFNLDLGNTDIRGFAAAAGNVVINGARGSVDEFAKVVTADHEKFGKVIKDAGIKLE